MSVICLMLFMTISILSSSLALRNTMQRDLKEMTPVDINLYKTANLPESCTNKQGKVVTYTKEQIEDSKITIKETLENNEFDIKLLKDIVEISIYATNDWTWHDSFGSYYDVVSKEYSRLLYDTPENFIKISDYNKIAKLYGIEQYELKDDEFIVVCDYSNMIEMRNNSLKSGNNTITLNGITYKSKYDECKSGYVLMSTSHTNTGIILVPDNAPLQDDIKEKQLLVANYNANTTDEKAEIEKLFDVDPNGEPTIAEKLYEKGIELDGVTKISIIESSVGIATIVTFIAIYLGIIFLIASAAILALKQLTESSDNKQRYTILRKIGCDENMINKALFSQIGIFFVTPLVLAIIHSIFGIKFALSLLSGLASADDLLPSVIMTVAIIGGIYGVYFIATYFESKNIIKECNN